MRELIQKINTKMLELDAQLPFVIEALRKIETEINREKKITSLLTEFKLIPTK